MIRAVLIAAVLLPGCASYSEMQAKAPVLEVSSAKTPAVYAGCVAPKFMEIWGSMVAVIPDADSTVVTVGHGSGMAATLTISPVESGSRAVMREMNNVAIGSAFSRARAAVQACI